MKTNTKTKLLTVAFALSSFVALGVASDAEAQRRGVNRSNKRSARTYNRANRANRSYTRSTRTYRRSNRTYRRSTTTARRTNQRRWNRGQRHYTRPSTRTHRSRRHVWSNRRAYNRRHVYNRRHRVYRRHHRAYNRRVARRHHRRWARRAVRNLIRGRWYFRNGRSFYWNGHRYYRRAASMTLTNHKRRAVMVQVRKGFSSNCWQNPVQGTYVLRSGQSMNLSTFGRNVCYRQVKVKRWGYFRTAIRGWSLATPSVYHQNLSL